MKSKNIYDKAFQKFLAGEGLATGIQQGTLRQFSIPLRQGRFYELWVGPADIEARKKNMPQEFQEAQNPPPQPRGVNGSNQGEP